MAAMAVSAWDSVLPAVPWEAVVAGPAAVVPAQAQTKGRGCWRHWTPLVKFLVRTTRTGCLAVVTRIIGVRVLCVRFFLRECSLEALTRSQGSS